MKLKLVDKKLNEMNFLFSFLKKFTQNLETNCTLSVQPLYTVSFVFKGKGFHEKFSCYVCEITFTNLGKKRIF